MTANTSHLVALVTGLHQERRRLADATGQERELRAVWVRQLEKEVAAEEAFLGMAPADDEPMTDCELLAELTA